MSNKHVPLKARKVSFAWEDTPLHWVPGDPFTTHTINVLHLLLPAGERWFVHVYKQVLPYIRDERLREDVIGFIGQEAMHSQAHDEVLPHLRDQGLDPTPYTAQVDWLFEKLLGDRTLPPGRPRRWWLLERVALIAAIEHYTAFLGDWVLNAEALDRRGADPTMLDLLRWHGAEEVEHRSVAFDLFVHVDGDYARRVRTWATAFTALVFLWQARDQVLHGERPDARRRPGRVPGLPPARPAGPAALDRRDRPFHTRLSEPLVPPVQGVLHRAGRRLPRRLPRRRGRLGRREVPGECRMRPRPKPVSALLLAAGAALVVRRALRRRVQGSPLWPLPALDPPVSGRPRTRALTLLVTAHERLADGVVLLRLEGTDLPRWEPGAHLDLVLPSGLVRQYSLCGDPEDTSSYTVAARLVEDGRGGSREVHEQVQEGTELEVRGPRNRFPLVEAPAYAFVAGGIGITPVLPMLRALPAGADWRLLYGGRTRASMPFLEEVEKLDPDGSRITVVAEDEDGRPGLDAFLADLPQGAAVYCCGPEGLMAAVEERLPAGAALHLERFAPRTTADGDAEFEVELRRSGRTLTVSGDSSVLAAVRAELPNTPYSCEQGWCGTCQQKVLEGEIDHRDELLTDSERGDSMLICVSRCLGTRLVLDM
ncbi:putative metal-dependent hydrolase/ferredoxin-NADP reductase [Streptomyces ambofaciens]